MKLRVGATLKGAKPELIAGLRLVDETWKTYAGHEVTITSGTDSVHLPNSLHYKGLAADLRVWDLPPTTRRRMPRRLREQLGADWDVVDEGNHIHIEFDPEEDQHEKVSSGTVPSV